MTNVESMDYTHSHPSTFASLSITAHFSPVSYTHHLPSSKQPPYLPIMAFHSHSEIYFHATFHRSVYHHHDILYFCHIAIAWSCSWHRICGKATIHPFLYMSLLIHCTSRYTAGGIHIESYLVLVLSCNSYVVINESVMIIIIRAFP